MRPQRPPSISNQIQIMMSNPEGHDCPDCFISFHASVLRLKKKKKRRQRERTGTKACCRRGRTPPSLHKPGILRPRPSLCFRTVSHSIGSLGTELFGRGPSALPKAEKLSKCKLKCVCFSVESQNDLSLLNGISYMCWVR